MKKYDGLWMMVMNWGGRTWRTASHFDVKTTFSTQFWPLTCGSHGLRQSRFKNSPWVHPQVTYFCCLVEWLNPSKTMGIFWDIFFAGWFLPLVTIVPKHRSTVSGLSGLVVLLVHTLMATETSHDSCITSQTKILQRKNRSTEMMRMASYSRAYAANKLII